MGKDLEKDGQCDVATGFSCRNAGVKAEQCVERGHGRAASDGGVASCQLGLQLN